MAGISRSKKKSEPVKEAPVVLAEPKPPVYECELCGLVFENAESNVCPVCKANFTRLI